MDRNRNVIVLASAARTATNTSLDVLNIWYRGIHVVLDVTAVPGVDTVTLTIQGKNPLTGAYYTLLAGAAVSTAVANVYKVYPGLPATANVSANDIVPTEWRVSIAHSAASSFTYSVTASMIL